MRLRKQLHKGISSEHKRKHEVGYMLGSFTNMDKMKNATGVIPSISRFDLEFLSLINQKILYFENGTSRRKVYAT